MKLEDLLKKVYYFEDVDVVAISVTRNFNGDYNTTIDPLKTKDRSKLRMNAIRTHLSDVHMSRYLDADKKIKSVMTVYRRRVTYIFGKPTFDEVIFDDDIVQYENGHSNGKKD